MPFKSDKQKRWMYANKPEMAKEWSAKEDSEERDKNREFADSLFAKSPEERARSKRAAERVLGKRRVARPPHLFTKGEDNEEPKRGITGLSPRRSPELHSMKSHAIDKIDLNKWREYPAEDVMKAVYRRYGKELPSVDSYDWAITWDKKVRPWLKNKFPAEDYERFENPYDDYVDDDAREQARRDDELMGDIKVDHDSIPKRPDLKKGMKDLDKEIRHKQLSFKDFYKKKN